MPSSGVMASRDRDRSDEYEGGRREHPAGPLGAGALLAYELAQVEERLVDGRADPTFESAADLAHEAHEQRATHDHADHLEHGHGDD